MSSNYRCLIVKRPCSVMVSNDDDSVGVDSDDEVSERLRVTGNMQFTL